LQIITGVHASLSLIHNPQLLINAASAASLGLARRRFSAFHGLEAWLAAGVHTLVERVLGVRAATNWIRQLHLAVDPKLGLAVFLAALLWPCGSLLKALGFEMRLVIKLHVCGLVVVAARIFVMCRRLKEKLKRQATMLRQTGCICLEQQQKQHLPPQPFSFCVLHWCRPDVGKHRG